MTDLEYHLLPLEERADLVFTEGTFVEKVEGYYQHTVVLYSLYSFWVEVHYSVEDNLIDAIQLAGPAEMQKFLSQIKIDTF